MRVYASPYTPAFNGFAFAYAEDEDRFNESENAIPEEVDIVMTHGPPLISVADSYELDKSGDGKHCGCAKLARAIRRMNPRLHCFGHIHEGRGVMRMNWDGTDMSGAGNLNSEKSAGPKIKSGMKGKETLFVNAAVQDGKGSLVDIEL